VATLIIVRRDASETFHHFQAMAAQKLDRDVELLWDRRTRDRRGPDPSVPVERRVEERRDPQADPGFLDQRQMERRQHPESRMPDRRRGERRRRAPDTWGTLGFVLVAQERPAAPSTPGEVSE
jgi:hypothetical protein